MSVETGFTAEQAVSELRTAILAHYKGQVVNKDIIILNIEAEGAGWLITFTVRNFSGKNNYIVTRSDGGEVEFKRKEKGKNGSSDQVNDKGS